MTIPQLETKERQALVLAAQLLVDNGLGDWHLGIKEVTSYHAQTTHRARLITLNSRAIRKATKEQFTGILYHEIAHALVGPGNGHGRPFKSKVWELTGSLEYAGYATRINIRKFLTTCENCGINSSTNKKGIRYCRPCFMNYRKTVVLQTIVNPLEIVVW